MLPYLHFLHIAFAIAWAGGTIFWVFILAPAMMRMEPETFVAAYTALKPRIATYLNLTGAALILSALARLYLGGYIADFADLRSSYSMHAHIALAILIGLAYVEGRFQSRISAILDNGYDRAALLRLQRFTASITAAGLFLIVALMTMLGLGYY